MRPTSEQLQILEAASRGDNLRIRAFAGAGKTTTLRLIAEKLAPHPGVYVAYNRTIAQEAAHKMPPNIRSRTAHSLAYAAIVRGNPGYRRKLEDGGRVTMQRLREHLDIEPGYGLTPAQIAGAVNHTLKRFLFSTAPAPLEEHVADRERKLVQMRYGEEAERAFVRYVLGLTREAWRRMADPNDPFPLSHDGYLRLWVESEDLPRARTLLIDEAQDLNPPIIAKARQFERAGGQVILVGDPNQQIYAWRGAQNAMDAFAHYRELPLTHSWRFGPAIAQVAQSILDLLGERHTIVGRGPKDSRAYMVENPLAFAPKLGLPFTVLARTNASLIEAFIELTAAGLSVSFNGGASELVQMLEDFIAIQEGRVPPPGRPLAGFASIDELEEYAAAANEPGLVRLVEHYGGKKKLPLARTILDLLRNPPEGGRGRVLLSTVHKAKGGEWESVFLMNDFVSLPPERLVPKLPLRGVLREEFAILYVALTRPKRELYLPVELAERIEEYARISHTPARPGV